MGNDSVAGAECQTAVSREPKIRFPSRTRFAILLGTQPAGASVAVIQDRRDSGDQGQGGHERPVRTRLTGLLAEEGGGRGQKANALALLPAMNARHVLGGGGARAAGRAAAKALLHRTLALPGVVVLVGRQRPQRESRDRDAGCHGGEHGLAIGAEPERPGRNDQPQSEREFGPFLPRTGDQDRTDRRASDRRRGPFPFHQSR